MSSKRRHYAWVYCILIYCCFFTKIRQYVLHSRFVSVNPTRVFNIMDLKFKITPAIDVDCEMHSIIKITECVILNHSHHNCMFAHGCLLSAFVFKKFIHIKINELILRKTLKYIFLLTIKMFIDFFTSFCTHLRAKLKKKT